MMMMNEMKKITNESADRSKVGSSFFVDFLLILFSFREFNEALLKFKLLRLVEGIFKLFSFDDFFSRMEFRAPKDCDLILLKENPDFFDESC
jgi:hypothetical protein